MFHQFFNWRVALAVVAIGIVTATVFYSRFLARKIAEEEKQKVQLWVDASIFLINSPPEAELTLVSSVLQNNDDIPIIVTDEKDRIVEHRNLDSTKLASDSNYLHKKLRQLKSTNSPIIWIDPIDSTRINRYYYGHTTLLLQVQYYPLVQLFIVGLFIIITLMALRSSYRSTQNQVWAGMAKETAHQLGTPVSSLEGWVEMLKENPANDKIVKELEKDVKRLQLVSDRFGKIGSTPQLEEKNLVTQIAYMVEYIRKRATGKVNFSFNTAGRDELIARISPPLFDWVIENLLKNALDAMEGKGSIKINMQENAEHILIDVEDTGKGISKQNIARVFKPGFTTKKRGWGLGLSLSKRIIEHYHKGELFVKHSEVGKGTMFRIVLKK